MLVFGFFDFVLSFTEFASCCLASLLIFTQLWGNCASKGRIVVKWMTLLYKLLFLGNSSIFI